MSDNSKIEWTDATWNPVRGCTKISPGCTHCYAETFAERFRGVKGHAYEQGFDLRTVPSKLSEPLKWPTPKLVFVNSMKRLFRMRPASQKSVIVPAPSVRCSRLISASEKMLDESSASLAMKWLSDFSLVFSTDHYLAMHC